MVSLRSGKRTNRVSAANETAAPAPDETPRRRGRAKKVEKSPEIAPEPEVVEEIVEKSPEPEEIEQIEEKSPEPEKIEKIDTPVSSEESDDDEPMEITSKRPETPEKTEKSIVERLLEKKLELEAKKSALKAKKKSLKRKREAKKVAEGVFEVKMRKSLAKFNVVTLESGVQNILEPTVNFRDELLRSRTAGSRLQNTEKFQQRANWLKK